MATQLTPGQIERWRAKAVKLQPTPNGSIYVKPQDMAWGPTQFPGIHIKVLYKDEAAGEMTCLLRWDPGARLPFHMHPEIEQRSMHETYSEEGCTILAIYRKPNVFAKSAGF